MNTKIKFSKESSNVVQKIFSSVSYTRRLVWRKRALTLSAFLVLAQVASPLSMIVAYAAPTTSNDVGSSAALDPVANKANRLQMQGSSGVDQSTGAFTYSYPLAIPDGRNGMTPKLALSYNSQNNETGWFGYGWNLSIPYIDRTTKTGTDKLYTSPAFVSSLHGELVSSNGSSFEQKVDDGSYAKYTFTGTTWQMTDRDGTTYYFGTTYESRIQDDTGVKIGRWYLNEVRDKFGNGIVYSYVKDGGSIYPSTISYTEHALAHPLNLVTFNLENKSDKFINYKYGFQVTDSKRISSIKVTTNGKDNSYFTFSYATGSNGYRSLLQGVEEKHLSTNDDWTALPKTTFEYENSSTTYSGSISSSVGPYGSNSVIDTNNDGILDLYAAGDGYFPVDINGDYKKDLVQSDITYGAYSSGRNVYFNYNQGSSTFFSRNLIKPTSPAYIRAYPAGQVIPPLRFMPEGIGTFSQESSVADVNGDGFDDVVYNNTYGPKGVAFNTTNNTFDDSQASNLWFNIGSDQIADVNGDGLQDKISKSYTSTSTVYNVYLNNGSSYSTSTDFFYDAKIASTSFDTGVRFVDVNNDGLIDVVRSYTSSYSPSGNPTCTTAYSGIPSPAPINQSANEIAINTGLGFKVSSSTLSGYLVSYSSCDYMFTSGYLVTKTSKEYDTNGDLTTDYDGSINNTQKQDVLKKVNTSLGATTDVSYTWSTKNNLNPTLPVPMYIVGTTTDKLSVSDQNPHITSYTFSSGQMYFDAANPRDHKFAGFGKVDVVDGNNKTTTYYHQGNGDDYSTGEKGDSYYNIGRAYRTDVYDLSSGSSTLVSKNLSLYTTYSYASSSFTYLDSQVNDVYNADGSYLSSGTKSIYDETKRLIKTTYAYGDIEPFISFASSTITDKGTDLTTTQYQYSNVRPQRLTKDTTIDYSGKTIASNNYYYDNLPLGLVDKGAVTNVVSTIYNPDGTVNATSTQATTYGPTGNVTQSVDGLNRVTKVIYDSSYFFPVTKIDALNGTTTLTYDPYTLNLLTSKGPDGITYAKETDGFGKVTRSYIITNGGGISDDVRTSYVYGGGLTIYGRRLGDMGASARTLEVYDSYGRLVQSKKETTPDSFSTQDTKYDAQSNVISTSLPYTTNGYGYTQDTPSNGNIIYTYDGLGRVLTKSVFGTTYSYQYGARNLTVTDNAGTQHKKSYSYDANNNLAQVKEYNSASTYTSVYNYTPQNKLSSITDASGNIRNFSYFSNGLLKYQEDTHAPTDTTYTTYSYTYDVLGNLLSKTGTLGTLNYTYDAINRPSSRVLVDSTYGTSTVSFAYTGCANNYILPCTINRGTSSTTLAYTTNGKVSSESLSMDGKTFARSYTYDIYGNPITITYPDNGKVTYTYSLDGKQSTLTYTTPSGATKNIVTDSSYNSLNSLTSMRYGNGVQMCNTYTTTSNEGAISPKLSKSVYLFNSTGCTSGIANQIELYKDEFTYKDALTPSNILSTYKDILGTTHTKNDALTYDNLVRLTGVSTSYDGGGAVTDTLVYDPIGNLLKQNDILFRYSVDGTQNAHAVTSIGGSHVTYDAQGNRIQFGDNTYTWNALNQILTASSTNGSEIYTYDEQGERLKKVVKATSIVSQKATPTTSSSSLGVFTQGDILATVATTSMYIATSTYNILSSVSLLDKPALTTLVSNFYGSPFTSKYCATAESPSLRQSCTASTTKQLIANNLNSRSTTTIATVGLVDDTIKIVTGALLIPSTYTGLATSSIATSSPTTFTIDSPTITSYNTFVATGIVVPMAEYSNLPYVSSSTYTSLSLIGLNDTSKVRALLTLSSCASIVTSCATAKKVVFEKYYKESGYLLSDKALEEMWYVFAAKARLPGNSNEFTASSTVLSSISIPTISGITSSSATSTYYSGRYFTTEYSNQNLTEPRLQYLNTIPYFITQSAFTELKQAGITQSTIDSYQSFIADLLGTKTASSTEYMFALKQFAQYDKNVTLSQNALKEMYLVVLGAATVPNNINDYTVSATFDLASYLSVQTVYGAYASTLSNTTSGCNGGTFSGGYGRCVIRVSPFSLPVATSSTVSYFLSVTAPNITEFVLNAGESSNTRAVVDNYNYGTQVPAIYSSRYAPATAYGGMLDYISGSISSDGFTQTIDVTSTIVKEKASSTEPANILLMNRSGWTNGEQYVYQASSTVLKAYVSTPHLTLASTTLVVGVTNATSSSFTSAIATVVSSYFGEAYDSSSNVSGVSTSTLTFVSQETYTEFASTTLRDSYALSKIFLSTSTPQCIADASTTECDKQARKVWFRQVVSNLSGFTPSQAATEEFWMAHKDLLLLPDASSSIALLYATSSHVIFVNNATTTVNVLSRLSLPQTLATSTATTTVNLSLVPSGLLSDLQYSTTYSTSTFALATSTRIVSEDTYNELLHTPIRLNSDVNSIFSYVLSYATSSCGGQSATSSCVVTAQKTKVKDVVSTLSGFVMSDAATEELYRVYIHQLSILPMSLVNANATTTTQSITLPLNPSEAFTTFSTTTVGTTTSLVANNGNCSFGTSGATTSKCYINIPYINSTVNSLTLSFDVSTSSISTTTLMSSLSYITQTGVASTTATSSPTFTTTIATTTITGQKTSSTHFSFDVSTLFKTFLNSSSPQLILTPDANGTSTQLYTISNPVLSVTRTILVPKISYQEFSTLVSTNTAPVQAVATTSLVAYYKMNNNSGDSFGTATGTDTSISYTGGRIDAAASFNGTNSKIALGSFTLGSAFTVSTWVKLNSTAGAQLLFSNYSGGGVGSYVAQMYASMGSGDIAYGNYTQDTMPAPTPYLSANTWYHIVVTNDGTTATIYLNGAAVRSATVPHASSTQTLVLGSRGDSQQYLNGLMDEVGIWNRPLSSTEVYQLYNASVGVQYPFQVVNATSSLVYGLNSTQPIPFDRTTIATTSVTTSTTSIDLTSAPTLDLSATFLSPVGRIASNGTSYTVTNVSTSSIVSYYKLEANSNDTLSANNGSDTSISYSSGAGKIGNGAVFNGTNSKIVTGPYTIGAAFSVSAWVRLNSTSGAQLLFSTYSGGGVGSYVAQMYASMGSGDIAYGNYTQDTMPAPTPYLSANTWYHIVVTEDGSTASIYLNGTLVRSATVPHTQSTTNALTFGSRGDSQQYLNGSLDEVAVFNRTLSSAEVLALYNSTVGLQYPFSVTTQSGATTTIYAGSPIDPTYPSLPTPTQNALPQIQWPLSATTSATSTLFLATSASTSQQVIYSPFAGSYSYNATTGVITTYFTLNGALVGSYTYQQGNEAATNKTNFILTNYENTPVLETDDKGDIVQMDITDVYGNYVQRDQRNDNAYHVKGFTSHEYDDVTGLNYVHARFLDPKAHSFLSVDPLNYTLPQSYLLDPQQLNTYSYARNNSVLYTDPNGQWVESGLDVAFLVYDLKELNNARRNGTASWKDYAYVVGDSAGLALPGVTGVGMMMRVGLKADRANEALNVVEKGSEALRNNEIPETLYHYTSDKGLKGILESKQINPSTRAAKPQDAKMGDGQYLTDIMPGSLSAGKLAYQLYKDGRKSASVKNYIEISTKNLNVTKGRDGVYFIKNSKSLDITNLIKNYGKN